MDSLTARLRPVLASPWTERIVMALIVVNAAILGLETSPTAMAMAGPLLLALDTIILAVFVVEIAARMLAHGWKFFRDPWSVFDFIVVGIALVPATGNLSVLRALRIIRALRLISAIKSMRRVVGGLLAAIPGMGSIVALLLLLFYVFSVMATKLFSTTFPQWFGTIGESAYSLFQIMTLESWSMGIVRPVMEVYPYAWAFFVPFIMMTTFAVVNLLVGLIVNSMQDAHSAEEVAQTESYRDEVLDRLRTIEARLADTGTGTNRRA